MWEILFKRHRDGEVYVELLPAIKYEAYTKTLSTVYSYICYATYAVTCCKGKERFL